MPEYPREISWEEFRYYLTEELSRMSRLLDKMSKQVNQIENKQIAIETSAKTNARWHGAIFGFCTAAFVEVGRVLVSIFTGKAH